MQKRFISLVTYILYTFVLTVTTCTAAESKNMASNVNDHKDNTEINAPTENVQNDGDGPSPQNDGTTIDEKNAPPTNEKGEKIEKVVKKYEKIENNEENLWTADDFFELRKREKYENKYITKPNKTQKTKYGPENQHIQPFIQMGQHLKLLVIAIKNDNISGISAVIGKGININGFVNGYTPLMYAVLWNKPQIAKYLIFKGSADVNIQNLIGQTALHIAALSCNIEMVKILLNGRGLRHIKDIYGCTPYEYSKTCGFNSPISSVFYD